MLLIFLTWGWKCTHAETTHKEASQLQRVWQTAATCSAALLSLQILAQLAYLLHLLPASAEEQDAAMFPVPCWLLEALGLHRIREGRVLLEALQVRALSHVPLSWITRGIDDMNQNHGEPV